MVIKIDGNTIPEADVKSLPRLSVSSNGASVVCDDVTIKLNNVQGKYGDAPGGLFYGLNWPDMKVEIFGDSGELQFTGFISNVQPSHSDQTCEVKVQHVLANVLNTTVDLNLAFVTPADLILEILEQCGVPSEYVNYSSFTSASAIQKADGTYLDCSLAYSKGAKGIEVINDLCELCCMNVYYDNSMINLRYWQPYNGGLGIKIGDKDIVDGQVNEGYTYGKYVGASLGFRNGDTIQQYGKVLFGSAGGEVYTFPKSYQNGGNAADQSMYFSNSGSCEKTYSRLYQRWYDPNIRRPTRVKILKMKLSEDYSYLPLYSQVDVTAFGYVAEPTVLVAKSLNEDDRTLNVELEFINYPKEFFNRVTTTPAPVSIEKFSCAYDSLTIRFSESPDADSYTIYLGNGDNDFKGRTVKSSQLTYGPDGLLEYVMPGLELDSKYRCYVTACRYAQGLESDPSNVITAYTFSSSYLAYQLRGNPTEGLVPEIGYIYNPRGWTTDFARYGTKKYNLAKYAPTYVFFDKFYGCRSLVLNNDVDTFVMFRTSPNGSTFSQWSTPEVFVGDMSLSFEGAEVVELIAYMTNTTPGVANSRLKIKEVSYDG